MLNLIAGVEALTFAIDIVSFSKFPHPLPARVGIFSQKFFQKGGGQYFLQIIQRAQSFFLAGLRFLGGTDPGGNYVSLHHSLCMID